MKQAIINTLWAVAIACIILAGPLIDAFVWRP